MKRTQQRVMDLWIIAVFALATGNFVHSATNNCQFLVTNPNKSDPENYDFSSLSTNTPWEVSDASDSKSKSGTVFLSICEPLKGLSKSQCPDESAFSCLARRSDNDKWKTVISNAGSNSTAPKLTYLDKYLILTLEGGQTCETGRNYSTKIIFTCNPQTIGEPYYIGLLNNCDVTLGWVTSAACPVTSEHDTCLLPVPGGRPLDLTALASKTSYTVQDPGSQQVFQLNLCNEIMEGVCGQGATACLVNSTTTIGKLKDGSELAHIPGGLALKYLEASGFSTEIDFYCNLTAPLVPEPLFIAQRNKSYVFRVDTPFACPAAPMDCVAYDHEGKKFDLNALRRTQGLWTVRDPRKGKSHLLYHINICGPLPPGLTPTCLAGNIGACMTNTKPNSPSYSLGFVEHPPKVTKEGTVLLEYRGGSPCKTSKFRRRVSIALECSAVEQGPALEAVHEDCSYAFLWRTPAACSAKPAQGDNCRVSDPNFGYTFDVRGLYNNQADYQVQGDRDDSFRVNLCGSLHKPCAGQDNVSVCLERSGKEIAIGHHNDRLLYQDGRLSFMLTGDECRPNVSSSVTIILSCEHQDPQVPSPAPQVFPSGQNDCRFFMVWNHPKACPPYHEVPCSVRDDDGQLYDLSELGWLSANHEARTSDGKRSGLLLNVCRSVVFGRDSPCQPSSGACLQENGKYINLGDVKEGPYIEAGQLRLKYDQGDMCTEVNGPSHMSTVINFICSDGAVVSSDGVSSDWVMRVWSLQDTQPMYMGQHQCVHLVVWITGVACAQPAVLPPTNSCSASNPVTKHKFDFNELKDTEFSALDGNGNKFLFGVCSPLKNTKCGPDSGSCQLGSNTVAVNSGKSNANLQFRMGGSLFLNYSDGEACGDGKRGTLIEFMCGVEGLLEGPRIVDVLDGCLTVVHWHTELACEKRIQCMITLLGQEVDLSPLIRVTQNYKVTASDGREFFLNVCRPVISVPGLSCPAGSAACVASKKNKTYQDELSLGFPIIRPVGTSSQDASLMYIHGSPCPDDPGINITSMIRFTCDPTAGLGEPKFAGETHDCQYQFDWATSLVCGEREEKVGTCNVYSEQLKRDISLESLQKPGGFMSKSKGNRRYIVNLCGDPKVCRGAAVCQDSGREWSSHGTLQRALYDYQNDYLKMQYSRGSHCITNETYGAEVWLRCNPTGGTGAPRVITEHACFVIFEWRTNAVCVSKLRTSTPSSPTLSPSSPAVPWRGSSSTTGAPDPALADPSVAQESVEGASAATVVAALLGVVLSVGLLVVIAAYARSRGHLCVPGWRLSRWIRSPTHSQVHYSRVASADEASHLLQSQPELEWDSDEELLKV